MQKTFQKTSLHIIGILAGTFVAALGVVAFILPSGIIMGSSTGIARIFFHYAGIPVSYTVTVVNGMLFAFGACMLGKKFAASTLIGTFSYPLFMNLFEHIACLQSLSGNPLLSTIYGGLLAGGGMGIVIRMGASTGGTDIVAIVLNKKCNIPLAPPMYLLDCCILLTQVVFAETTDQVLLGILVTMLYSVTAGKVAVAGNSALQLFIISEKSQEIRARLAELVVGATVFYGETGYLKEPRNTLLCVVPSHELNQIQKEILRIDSQAFLTISSVKEVKGRGYTFDVGLAKRLRQFNAAEPCTCPTVHTGRSARPLTRP